MLTVQNVLLACSIRSRPIPRASAWFYDFDESERLVEAALADETIGTPTWLCSWAGRPDCVCGECSARTTREWWCASAKQTSLVNETRWLA